MALSVGRSGVRELEAAKLSVSRRRRAPCSPAEVTWALLPRGSGGQNGSRAPRALTLFGNKKKMRRVHIKRQFHFMGTTEMSQAGPVALVC